MYVSYVSTCASKWTKATGPCCRLGSEQGKGDGVVAAKGDESLSSSSNSPAAASMVRMASSMMKALHGMSPASTTCCVANGTTQDPDASCG